VISELATTTFDREHVEDDALTDGRLNCWQVGRVSGLAASSVGVFSHPCSRLFRCPLRQDGHLQLGIGVQPPSIVSEASTRATATVTGCAPGHHLASTDPRAVPTWRRVRRAGRRDGEDPRPYRLACCAVLVGRWPSPPRPGCRRSPARTTGLPARNPPRPPRNDLHRCFRVAPAASGMTTSACSASRIADHTPCRTSAVCVGLPLCGAPSTCRHGHAAVCSLSAMYRYTLRTNGSLHPHLQRK
jgi:hypothetical protein